MIFKRGLRGVYQHCSEKHLHRYLAEFDYRYSNRSANGFDDVLRSVEAMKSIRGKRLMYIFDESCPSGSAEWI